MTKRVDERMVYAPFCVKPSQHKFITEAARMIGLSYSKFVRDAALKAAEDLMKQQAVIKQ